MVEKRCCCPFVSPRRRHNKQEGILLKRRHKLSFAAASGAGGNAWTWGRGWWHKGCPHAQGHRVVSPHPAHGSISSGLVTPPRCRTPRLSLSPGTVLLPRSLIFHARRGFNTGEQPLPGAQNPPVASAKPSLWLCFSKRGGRWRGTGRF